jgi:hypothetical protein
VHGRGFLGDGIGIVIKLMEMDYSNALADAPADVPAGALALWPSDTPPGASVATCTLEQTYDR